MTDPPETSTRSQPLPTPTTITTQEEADDDSQENAPILRLRLQAPREPASRIKWSSDTIDNENMGKKKSKCCCIYKKPKVFGESDSSDSDGSGDDDCTAHCHGHKKKCYKHVPKSDGHTSRDLDDIEKG